MKAPAKVVISKPPTTILTYKVLLYSLFSVNVNQFSWTLVIWNIDSSYYRRNSGLFLVKEKNVFISVTSFLKKIF
jgi:hypothetical protein